jgi:AcrR family transcriptional regulator
MRRNQRNSTESTTRLARQQADVIAALMRGASVTDATREANVDRTTFYLWLKSDAAFQAELNRAKQEQAEAMRAQLRGLADVAVSTIREMLTGADVPAGLRLKAALAVLQTTGMLKAEEIGTTDPESIERDRKQQSLLDAASML